MAKKNDKIKRAPRSSSASYRRDLEKLFESGGEVPERFKEVMETIKPEEGSEEAAWLEEVEKLRAARDEGFRALITAADDFVAAGHKLPDDEELLARLLDHPKTPVLRATLAHLVDLDERVTIQRVQPIKSRLRTIRTMSHDPMVRQHLDALEQRLG